MTEPSPGLARWSRWESYAGSQGERTIFASCSYDSGRQTFVPAGLSPRGVAADLLEPGPCRRLPRGSGTLVPGQLLQATSDSLPGRLSSWVQFPGESLWQSGDRTAVVTPNLTVAAWIGEPEGRPSFERGLEFHGRAYFADFDGVVAYNPRTRVFRAFPMPWEEEVDDDGPSLFLLTDTGTIEARGQRLWWVGEKVERAFRPETGGFGPLQPRSSPPEPRSQSHLPLLGGPLRGESVIEGRRLLWGDHGLVLLDGPTQPLEFQVLKPEVRLSRDAVWQLEADQVRESNYGTENLNGYLESENPYVRRWALQESIVWHNRKDPVPSERLRRCLSDPDGEVRRLALVGLAERPADAGPKLFQAALADPEPEVRVAAAWGLVLRRQRPPTELLEPVARRYAVRGEIFLVAGSEDLALLLRHAWSEIGPVREARELLLANPRWLPALLSQEEPSSFTDRWFEVSCPEIFPLLYPQLRSADPKVRAGAARLCFRFPRPESGPPLLAAARQETDRDIQARLIEALSRTGYHQSLPWLLSLRDSPDAALAVFRLDPARGEPLLVGLCRHKSARTRLRAARELITSPPGPAGIACLRRLLYDPDRDVRLVAALVLLEWDDPAGQQRVLSWLRLPTIDLLRALMAVRPERLEFAREALERIARTPSAEAELAWRLLRGR